METKGRMINDTALIRQIFRKWRRMVLVGLLVGLAAGGLQAKKLLPEIRRSTKKTETPAGQIDQEGISAERALITEQLRRKNLYFQKSVKARIDPTAEGRAMMVFSVTTPEIQAGMDQLQEKAEDVLKEGSETSEGEEGEENIEITAMDSLRAIKIFKSYRKKIISGFEWGDLPKEMNTEPQFLNELIGLNQESEGSITATITAMYIDKEGAKKILEQVARELKELYPTVAAVYGKHYLLIDTIEAGTIVDGGMYSWHKDRLAEINNLASELEKFDLASPGLITSYPQPVRMRKRVFLMNCIKMGAVGFVGGMILYAVLRALLLILSGKVLSARELNNQYRINKIAAIPEGRELKGIDALVNKPDSDYYSNPDVDVSYRIANENVRNAIASNSIVNGLHATGEKTQIALVGDLTAEEMHTVFKKLLANEPSPQVEYVSVPNLNSDPEALKKLEESDAAVLVAEPVRSKYRKLSDILGTVRSYDKELLGSIVAD